jgi:hypothetical protein
MEFKMQAGGTKKVGNHVPKGKCVAIIGDLINSRELIQRPLAQESLISVLKHCNRTYKSAILSKFVITAGDEFQGLLKNPICIPDIIWDIEMLYKFTEVKIGIGFGGLSTKLNDVSIGMDGPVWYAARDALERAAKNKQLGGVFFGFKHKDNIIINGLARVLYHHRKSSTDKQRMIMTLLRQGYNQTEIANKLHVSKPVISGQTQSSGWDAYHEGESAWRTVLSEYDQTEYWNNE